MKKFTFFRGFVSLLIFAFVTSSVSVFAQNAPIGCNGQYYVSHGASSGNNSSTALEKLSFSGLTITPNSFTLSPGTYGFNAIGLSPIDGYIYAIRYPASSGGDQKSHLLRIGTGGTNVTDLGAISALADNDIAYSATFDAAGIFYFTTSSGRFMKIDDVTSSVTATQIASSGFSSYADIAVNPVGGQMFGTTNSSTDWLFLINKATGAISSIAGEPSLGGSNFFAGLFFDETGNLFGYRSDGPFYRINTSNGALTPAGSSTSYTFADGCSCSFGRVYHDLSVGSLPLHEVCSININPNPTVALTVSVVNESLSQQTGLTYTLNLPGNRFSFNEDAATIKTNLVTAGVMNASGTVVISGANNDNLVVTQFQTGAATTTKTFTLQIKLTITGGTYVPVPLQSEISGLTPVLGLTDLSNDPLTTAPDDPTVLTFCPEAPLPVKLLSFSGVYKNDAASINWETESQVNFAYYDLERSTDGISFSSLTIKPAKNSNSGRQQYQYLDDLASENGNIFYYRLRMVDLDGSAKYSNVVMIRRDLTATQDISVIPNPVNHSMAIVRFTATESGIAEIRIINMAGKLVLSQKNNIYEGINSLSVNNLNSLQSGTYLLQIARGKDIMNSKFVVSKY